MLRGAPDYDDQMPEVTVPRPEGRDIVDEERALEALRRVWGHVFVICLDEAVSPPWQAWRLDCIGVKLTGATPDKLDAAIRADHTDGG